jgi:putative ABC transport system ATP-binding protein
VTIRIDNLLFRWPRQATPCLDIPQLSIAAGEHVFLYGPSGCGKSTLLSLLAAVNVPERGTLRLLDQNVTELNSRQRDRLRADSIGVLFQQFNLLPWLSAIGNVLLPCTFSKRRHARAATQHSVHDEAVRLLTQLDLAPALWTKPATELSVGQQQRVAAARSLIGQPELLIADEPTSALDAERQQLFIDLLLKECRAAGSTLVFVSHDHRLAEPFGRRIDLTEVNRAAIAEDML